MPDSRSDSPVLDPKIAHLITQETRRQLLSIINRAGDDGISLRELDDRIEKHKSTIHEHLQQFVEHDVLEADSREGPQNEERVFYSLTDYGTQIVSQTSLFNQ